MPEITAEMTAIRQRQYDEREVPEGYELVAVTDPDWRVEDGSDVCRHNKGYHRKGPGSTCQRPAVMALKRTSPRGRYGPTVQWWRYCADHSYGRWIEDGKVMHWILREKQAGRDVSATPGEECAS